MTAATSAAQVRDEQLSIRGLRIHAQIRGEGEPLLLFSGIWGEVGLWEQLLPHLRGFRTIAFDPDSDDPRQQELARHIVRHAERRPVYEAGLARLDYIGDSGAPPGGYRMEMIHLPKGVGVRGYGRGVEDSYLVLDGALTVGWEDEEDAAEERLGPMDVILNPPGRNRYFRNDGVADAVFMRVSGNPPGHKFHFEPAK